MKLFEGVKDVIEFELIDHEAIDIVAHLVCQGEILGGWATPPLSKYKNLPLPVEKYAELTLIDGKYTGAFAPEITINKPNHFVQLELREFLDDDLHPIGVCDVLDEKGNRIRIADNTLKNVDYA